MHVAPFGSQRLEVRREDDLVIPCDEFMRPIRVLALLFCVELRRSACFDGGLELLVLGLFISDPLIEQKIKTVGKSPSLMSPANASGLKSASVRRIRLKASATMFDSPLISWVSFGPNSLMRRRHRMTHSALKFLCTKFLWSVKISIS